MDAAGKLCCRCGPGHRHAVGRRRDVPLGHGALHRRFVVLRRAAARGLHASSRGAGARDGRRSGKNIDREAVEAYLRAVDVPRAIAGVRERSGARSAACAARICAGLAVMP